jgi:hypothetical protein
VVDAGVVAGSDDGGSDDGGSDDGGVEDGGSDDGGSDEGGSEDGGSEDGGSDDGGADEGGADEGGAEDDGGLDEDGADLVGLADPDPDPAGWPGAELVGELIGVGARDVLELGGLRNALGDTDFEGDALAAADGPDPRTGAVAELPAAACGWPCPAVGVWFAPIRANAATADPTTTPPVRPAEASGREIR